MLTDWLGRILGAAAGYAAFMAIQSRLADEQRYLMLGACIFTGVLLGGIFDMRRQRR